MEDLTGRKFGMMTVIEFYGRNPTGIPRWTCKCDCGQLRIVTSGDIKRRTSATCGCGRKKTLSAMFRKHGLCNTPEYHSWMNIIARCTNPKHPRFKDYGGRGITMCERWRESFANFLADMGLKPTAKHSVDRKDTNGHYEPDNCRWATPKEQGRNTRTNHFLTHEGRTLTLTGWSEVVGISHGVIRTRIERGWSVADALTSPVNRSNKYVTLKRGRSRLPSESPVSTLRQPTPWEP